MKIKQVSKNTLTTPVIILICVISVCSFCGLMGMIGNFTDSNKTSDTASQPIKSASPTPAVRSLVSEITNTFPDNITKEDSKGSKSVDSKTAIVITENANLRESADNNSEVIQTIGEGEEITVIRQKGVWFYVSYSGQKGWMHGNKIKYKHTVSTKLPGISTATVSRPAPVYKTPERSVNHSGATAKCRDGTLSYSAHRRGTCSHHGGVAIWY